METFQLLNYLQTIRYGYISPVTGLAYDILLNLDEEVELIWRSAWSLPKVLYIISRYYHLAWLAFSFNYQRLKHASQSTCVNGNYFETFGGIIFMSAVVNFIFVLRVSALYGHSRAIIVCLSILYAVIVCVPLVVGIVIVKESFQVPPDLFLEVYGAPDVGCLTALRSDSLLARYNRQQILAWTCSICGDLIILLLMIGKIWQQLSTQKMLPLTQVNGSLFGKVKRLLAGRDSPVLASVCMDGILYFGIILALVIESFVFFARNSYGLDIFDAIVSPWRIAFYSIAGTRLILHLRRISLEVSGGSETSISTPIQFGIFAARASTLLTGHSA